jgi:hypothetical protein
MTATSAQVRFAAGGVVKVELYLHLTGNTYIDCFTTTTRLRSWRSRTRMSR